MTTAIEHLSNLHYNPIVHEYNFFEFYKALSPRKNDILLSYLVLPMYFNSKTNLFFRNAKTTSSIITLSNKRERLIGLENSLVQFKGLTNRCIQRLLDEGYITIDNAMSINVRERKGNSLNNKNINFFSNLARILSQNEVDITYRLLGIKKL
ncbi:three component ABC system middle component [Enterobacter cancerogenus]